MILGWEIRKSQFCIHQCNNHLRQEPINDVCYLQRVEKLFPEISGRSYMTMFIKLEIIDIGLIYIDLINKGIDICNTY